MKRLLVLAAVFAVGFGAISQYSWSQVPVPNPGRVYQDFDAPEIVSIFDNPLRLRPTDLAYHSIPTVPVGNKKEILPSQLTTVIIGGDIYDIGYVKIPLPWPIDYCGARYTDIYMSVNGFATLVDPLSRPNPQIVDHNNADGLFIVSSSYQDNVLAPFWGNHRYRSPGINLADGPFRQTHMFYGMDTVQNLETGNFVEVFVLEWENLNVINQGSNVDNINSWANFQLVIYKPDLGPTQDNLQSTIEFCYGQWGGAGLLQGASVGLKGDVAGDRLNGLCYIPDSVTPLNLNLQQRQRVAITSTIKSTFWRPTDVGSSGDARRIRFAHINRKYPLGWGDGDADISQIRGRRHWNYNAGSRPLPQSRFVTVNDARLVMRWLVHDPSVINNDSLKKDSLLYRNAYHADVNHNGRYYFTNLRRDFMLDSLVGLNVVTWRRTIDMDNWTGARIRYDSSEVPKPASNYPPDALPLKIVYYEANVADAGWIMQYISGRVPSLPWIWDTTVNSGRMTSDDVRNATDIESHGVLSAGVNQYKVPVYLNGDLKGALGLSFTTDAKVLEVVQNAGASGEMLVANTDHQVFIAGAGDFDPTEPIAYVIIETDKEFVSISSLELNDARKSERTIALHGDVSENVAGINAAPNPMVNSTTLTFNVPAAGVFSVAAYDVLGNRVRTISHGNLNAGVQQFAWDGRDERGAKVATGFYTLRVDGLGTTLSTKVVVAQ